MDHIDEYTPKPVVGALTEVTWRDAYFDFDRSGEADAAPRDDYLVVTVGYLLSVGIKFWTLAQEVLPEGDGYRAVTHIPSVGVEHWRTFSEPLGG